MEDFVTSTERLSRRESQRLAKKPSRALLRRAGQWVLKMVGVALLTVLVAGLATAVSMYMERVFTANAPKHHQQRYPTLYPVPTMFVRPLPLQKSDGRPASASIAVERV